MVSENERDDVGEEQEALVSDDGSEETGSDDDVVGVAADVEGGQDGEDEGAEPVPGDQGGAWAEPLWRRRQVQIAAGAAALVVALVLVVFLVTGGGGEEDEIVLVDEEIDFSVEEVPVDVVVVDAASLVEQAMVLDEAERLELLKALGVSEEEAEVAAASGGDQPWRLNSGASDVPTDLKPWERHALVSGAMGRVDAAPGGSINLVTQDVMASLGRAVWPMVQAHQLLRGISSTQSLVDWDFWSTQGDLILLDSHLEAAEDGASAVRMLLSEAEFGVSARTREYVQGTLGGMEHLRRGREVAVELNDSFGGGTSWETLDPHERSRLTRLFGQDLLEALSEFDRVMVNYGCSVCGELYRNPPDGSPVSMAGPGGLVGTHDVA